MTLEEIFEQSRDCFLEALGLQEEDEKELTLKASLIDDLGAESLDFLDLAFRLERRFKIKIPRGGLEERIRGEIREEDFEDEKGVLTDTALDRLRQEMPEADPSKIVPGLKKKDIFRLITVETFLKIVKRQLEAGSA